MRAKDTGRAAELVEARDDLRHVIRALKRSSPRSGYDRRVMTIAIQNVCDAGAETAADVQLELPIGRKLIPIIRGLIAAELRRLGVTR